MPAPHERQLTQHFGANRQEFESQEGHSAQTFGDAYLNSRLVAYSLAMPLFAGSRLGRYDIIAALGAGGMGEVYRARDSRLGRDVALKVLPAGVATDAVRLARFEHEARIVAGLNHPNIVTLYSVEDEDGIRFLTMELVEGVRSIGR